LRCRSLDHARRRRLGIVLREFRLHPLDGARADIACHDHSRGLTHAKDERHAGPIRDAFLRMAAQRPRGRGRRQLHPQQLGQSKRADRSRGCREAAKVNSTQLNRDMLIDDLLILATGQRRFKSDHRTGAYRWCELLPELTGRSVEMAESWGIPSLATTIPKPDHPF
jgi:hypothetical protein